jgi:hypothetical protein
MRGILSPVFTSGKLKIMMPTIHKVVQRLLVEKQLADRHLADRHFNRKAF